MLLSKTIPTQHIFLKRGLIFFLSVIPLISLFCVQAPETPYQPKNTSIRLVLESSDKRTDEFTLVDTVEKSFRVGVRSNMTLYIDSIRISMFSQTTKLMEKDTFLSCNENSDTQWCSFVFHTEGARSVITRAFIQGGGMYSDSASISIFARPNVSSINHAPQWIQDTVSLPGHVNSGMSFALGEECFDPDSDSIRFFLQPDELSGDSIINDSYFFTPLPNDTGVFWPRIIAKDIHGWADTVAVKLAVTAIKPVQRTCLVIYNGNGNTGGTVLPTVDYDSGTLLTISGNGDLVKTGHSFNGWNSTPDGGGKTYEAGAKLSIDTMNVTLYAQWVKNQYSITYNGNGSASGVLPLSTNHFYQDQVTIAAAGSLVKTGYSFFGWNTDSTGKGIDYAPGSTFTLGAENATLYARWTINKYKVTYNGNGNDGGKAPDEVEYDFNALVTIAGKGTLSRTGYTFISWNTSAKGDGTDYAPGSTFTMGTDNKILFAKWSADQYTVSFDAKGGSAVAATTVSYDGFIAEPAAPTRQSYTFAGWFKEDSCKTQWTFSKDTVKAPMTLYAKWVVKDIDGNIYTTVTIGSQVWLVENLKTTRLRDGTVIPLVTDSALWIVNTTPGYCWYNNDSLNKNPYGALYNYYAVKTNKLSPSGWHIASSKDWDTLLAFVGGDSVIGGNLKETGYAHWNFPNKGATNEVGFSAVAGGARAGSGEFRLLLENGNWWIVPVPLDADIGIITIYNSEADIGFTRATAGCGFSVRCVRDY